MEYLTFNNGIQMPIVGFGTFMLSEKTCTQAVTSAINSGYRMIDTAEAYGNEKEVGEGIKQSGIDRAELFLVTKVNFYAKIILASSCYTKSRESLRRIHVLYDQADGRNV